MNINVIEATVLLTQGTDRITLNTDLPCPFIKSGLPSQPSLGLSFDATYDTGVEYCRTVFRIEPKVINVR